MDVEKKQSFGQHEKAGAPYGEKHPDAPVGFEKQFDGEPPKAQADTLHRGLKSRQISMIAIGGAVGTGLIIGSGTALVRGGPAGLLIGYSVMGLICYTVMCALGEMATHIPHRKGFSGYASRFVDEALGTAAGYSYLCKYLIVTPNNIVAASVVIQYWPRGAVVPIAGWLVVFIVAIGLVNLLGIRVFGEVEFWLSLIKVITLIGLIIMSLCLTAGANPRGQTIGFRFWDAPSGPFASYKLGGTIGRFLGVWSTFTNALFAYMGTELIGVTIGEASNPRKNIPSAIKKTFWRILVFYVGGVFCISLIVASNDPGVFVANRASTSAAASPFVVAIRNFGIQALPSIINAAVLVFVLSAANSDLYIASRTLYALAEEDKVFFSRTLLRVNKLGCPLYCLGITWLFCFLSYLRTSSSGATVFGYFVNLVTLFGAVIWMTILLCHIRFVNAFKAQGVDRSILRYRAPFGVIGSWIALIITAIITFFKGFDSFIPNFQISLFMTSYVGIVVPIAAYIYTKIRYRTRLIPLVEIDLFSGKQEIDDDEAWHLAKKAAKGPQPWYKRWLDDFI